MVLFNRRKYMKRRGSPQGAPMSLTDAVVTLSSETIAYTGSPVYPSVSVVYEGATLVVNADYTLAYADNTNLGAATVVVTGMGEFTGSVVKTFQIVAAGGGGAWQFDITQMADVPSFAKFTDSAAVWQICPSADESVLLVGTGSGYYIRSGTWSGFDPSAWTQTGISSSGVNAGAALYTPDGLHYLFASPGGNTLLLHEGSVAYDVATINTSASHWYTFYQAQIRGAAISSDGLHLLVLSSYGSGSALHSYDLQTAWDLSSITNDKYITTTDTFRSGPIWVNPDSPRQLVAVSSGYRGGSYVRDVSLVALEAAWDASSVESVETKTLGALPSGFQSEAALCGVAVNRAGDKMVLTLQSNSAGYAALVNLTA